MNIEDMMLVSVDDHVVEPPDLFEGHLAGQVPGHRAKRHQEGRRHRRVALRGPGAAEHRPQRGVRPAARGVRHRADRVLRDAARLLRHPPARRGHERERHARVDVLPVLPAVLRAAVRPHGGQGLGLAMLQAYNDWHIDEWCGAYPGRFIPLALPACGTPSWPPPRCAASPPRGATR